jgi:hypothetical protein
VLMLHYDRHWMNTFNTPLVLINDGACFVDLDLDGLIFIIYLFPSCFDCLLFLKVAPHLGIGIYHKRKPPEVGQARLTLMCRPVDFRKVGDPC